MQWVHIYFPGREQYYIASTKHDLYILWAISWGWGKYPAENFLLTTRGEEGRRQSSLADSIKEMLAEVFRAGQEREIKSKSNNPSRSKEWSWELREPEGDMNFREAQKSSKRPPSCSSPECWAGEYRGNFCSSSKDDQRKGEKMVPSASTRLDTGWSPLSPMQTLRHCTWHS